VCKRQYIVIDANKLSLVCCDWLAMGVAVNRQALKRRGNAPPFPQSIAQSFNMSSTYQIPQVLVYVLGE